MDSTSNSMLDDYGRHMVDYGRMVERHHELLYQARLVRMFPSAQTDTWRKHAFNLRMAADTRKIAKMYLTMAKIMRLEAENKMLKARLANDHYGHDYAAA